MTKKAYELDIMGLFSITLSEKFSSSHSQVNDY